MRSEAERLGIGWAFWDFATDFGAFDLERGEWREPLRRALLPDDGGRPGREISLCRMASR